MDSSQAFCAHLHRLLRVFAQVLLEAPRPLEAVISSAGNYKVVNHFDVENATRLHHCPSEFPVSVAWVGITGRVIVSNDYRTGHSRKRGSAYFTRLHRHRDPS